MWAVSKTNKSAHTWHGSQHWPAPWARFPVATNINQHQPTEKMVIKRKAMVYHHLSIFSFDHHLLITIFSVGTSKMLHLSIFFVVKKHLLLISSGNHLSKPWEEFLSEVSDNTSPIRFPIRSNNFQYSQLISHDGSVCMPFFHGVPFTINIPQSC